MRSSWLLATICLLFACGTPQALQVSPVQKVIELLENLKGKVTADLDAEAKAMDEYMKYCDFEAKDTEFAIKTAQRDLEDLGAVVEDSSAGISNCEDEISTISSDIAMKETEQAEARKVRDTEHQDFKDAEKQLLDTIDEMSRAQVTIKKQGSFLQAGGKTTRPSPSDLQRMMNALQDVVTAEWVDAGSKKRLTKFLQAEEQAGAEEFSMNARMLAVRNEPPQGSSSNYDGHSGGILDTITDMGEKAQQSLSEVRKKELQAQHTFDMQNMQLKDQINLLKNKLADATSRKSGAAEAKAKASGEAAGLSKSMQADQDYLRSLHTECSEKQSSWDERKDSSAEEIAAINKAIEILASGVKASAAGAFFQQKKGPLESRRKAEKREEVTTLLRELAKKFHSYALMSMASAASNDPFAKIRGLIEDMVARLVSEANEEATHKSFCDEELSKSTKSKEEKVAAMDEFQSRSDKASSMVATREEKVKVLQSEVADIDAAQRESAKVRQQEKANFLKTNKEYTESATAVSQAIQVLKDYYEGASFVQTKKVSKSLQSKAVQNGDAAGSIISILEMAEGDFTKLVAEGQTQENQAVEAFRKLAEEDEFAKTIKMKEVGGLQSEIKSLEVQLNHYNEDHATAASEFDAVMDYMAKLRPECESKTMSYEERKARRDAEIEGLKEALAILEGEGIMV